jgi:CDP-diacylglycerol---glycerol-3-phosphate 3-phosphatidyltransferase
MGWRWHSIPAIAFGCCFCRSRFSPAWRSTPSTACWPASTARHPGSALYLPFALVPGLPAAGVAIAAVLAGLTEMAGVVAQANGGGRRYDGPMGKSDRAFAFGLLAFLLGIGFAPDLWSNVYIWAIVALLALTIVNRVRRALAAAAAP